ncbi:Resolvase domain [Rhodospirillaceae bacterium LM-1]|nr:Resolvase domain [Rhodospirillaceae bacterium LM-1]
MAEYAEPGASAMDDQRPEFQKMIERATDGDRPFDVIVVHSLSRFFRDAFGLEMYVRKLAKVGVRLVSITQELGDDPSQVMMRQVIALFDEYQSRENAKHVMRAMLENARQGFYNGSPVPLGYTTQEVEKRGSRIKKKLAVDPVEAEIVKLIFRLYLYGDGQSGPLGIKEIVKFLNSNGYRTRRQARFGIATIHKLLMNRVYVGEWIFNKREAKTLKQKPVSEQVVIPVPPIIERTEFESVQRTLKSRRPNITPPRVTTGPILLTGLAVCSTCGGAMTLRTGTSRNHSVYRYYSCSTAARMGKSACPGQAIAMDRLDQLVTEHLCNRLLTPERLAELLASVAISRAEKAAEIDSRVTALQTRKTEAEEKLKRLYRMVEEGVTEIDELLKDRINELKEDRDQAEAALDRIRPQALAMGEIPPQAVERFGRLMRENISNGSIEFRRAYLRGLLDRIEVGEDRIRLIGQKATLEQLIAGKETGRAGVRSFVRKWRTRRDSNSQPPDS